jgi:hypothetical protein
MITKRGALALLAACFDALVNCGHERRNRAPAFIWAISASLAPLGNRYIAFGGKSCRNRRI